MARGRALLWAGAVGVSSLALIAGCAAVPVSGVAQRLQGTAGQPQQFVEPLPPPGPQAGESGPDVVSGFLHASASFAQDADAARSYLARGVKWHPAGTVTIVSPNLRVSPPSRVPPTVSEQSVLHIVVTGQRIATINRSGQYSYQPDASTSFTFTLAKFGARLLITQLPANTPLLLTQSDFQEVFQPHNLYFYASNAYPSVALVPDPVYVPVQGANSALSTTVAGSLVNALINDRGSWLAGPTTTEFPAGTTLLHPVTIRNQVALVDLGGKVATANQAQLELMYAQLKLTLTSSAYSPPVATRVEMAVNGRILSHQPKSPDLVTDVGSAAGLEKGSTLYLASAGMVQQLRSRGRPSLVPGLAQLDSPAGITALAVTGPGSAQRFAEAVPAGGGCVVHVGTLGPSADYNTYTMSVTGGPCTSLSWDNLGNLWAVTGSGISWLQSGDPRPVSVSLPSALIPRAKVLSLRIAPDAVRAAMVVRAGGKTQLYVAAIKYGTNSASFGPAVPVGTDLVAGVSALTWYSPYYLLAVSGSQVYQVPLTGGPLANGQSTPLGAGILPAGVQSLAAAGPDLAVGTASGAIYTSTAPYISWARVPGNTSQPTFAG